MPSVAARSLGVIMWCLPLVLQPSTTLASEQQAKASSEQQTKNPNAPPAFNESAQPPGAQARDGSPGKKPLASPSVAVSRKEEAWHTLETACTGDIMPYYELRSKLAMVGKAPEQIAEGIQ